MFTLSHRLVLATVPVRADQLSGTGLGHVHPRRDPALQVLTLPHAGATTGLTGLLVSGILSGELSVKDYLGLMPPDAPWL